MKMWVHYDASTGAIIGWETGEYAEPRPGFAVAPAVRGRKPMLTAPDSMRHKISLKTLKVVKMRARERRAAALPSEIEIRSAVAVELLATDSFVTVADRPLPGASTRDAWVAYRQMLRDLSKPQDERQRKLTPAEMVTAWPMRPDGTDPVAGFRSRTQD